MTDWSDHNIAEGLGLPNPSSVYEILRGGEELDFRGRSNLVELERQLYMKWGLGRNLILAWAPYERGVLLLVVPHYAVAAYTVSTHGMAPDQSDDHDFVVRFFAPSLAVPEDPVTGSAFTQLAPYWTGRLGRSPLRARQISARGGEVICEPRGDRVLISGRAAGYLSGTITVPYRVD